jgi:hypothetical protein
MNDSSEMWSQPWQALQKNLVKGIRGAEMLGYSAPSLEASSVASVAVPADSWLSRARRRAPPVRVRVRQ